MGKDNISEKTKASLRGFSKIIYVCARIAWIFLIFIAGVILLAGTVCSVAFGNMVKSGDCTYTEDVKEFEDAFVEGFDLQYNGDPEVGNTIKEYVHKTLTCEDTTFIRVLIIAYVASIMILVIAAIIFMNIDKLFKSFVKNGTPFNEKAVKTIRVIGYMMIINYVVGLLFSYILTNMLSFIGTYNYDINLGSIYEILIVFAIAYVLKYGYELQNNLVGMEEQVEASQREVLEAKEEIKKLNDKAKKAKTVKKISKSDEETKEVKKPRKSTSTTKRKSKKEE